MYFDNLLHDVRNPDVRVVISDVRSAVMAFTDTMPSAYTIWDCSSRLRGSLSQLDILNKSLPPSLRSTIYSCGPLDIVFDVTLTQYGPTLGDAVIRTADEGVLLACRDVSDNETARWKNTPPPPNFTLEHSDLRAMAVVGRSGLPGIAALRSTGLNTYTTPLTTGFYAVAKDMSNVSSVAKTNVTKGKPLDMSLVDNKVVLGFPLPTSPDLLYDDVAEWVRVKEHDPVREFVFKKYFRVEVDRVVRESFKDLRGGVLSKQEWVKDRAAWATSGGGGGSPVVGTLDGETVKTSKSKRAAAYIRTDAELLRSLNSEEPTVDRGFIKPERAGRNRPVISGDFDLYLQMAYVEHWWRPRRTGKLSPLFMSEDDWVRRQDEIRKALNGVFTHCPFDSDRFDHQVRKWMLEYLLESLETLCIFPEVAEMISRIRARLAMPGKVLFGDREFVWLEGLLSGWLWTAVFGTIVNIAVIRTGTALAADMTGEMKEAMNVVGQGDDGSMWSASHNLVFQTIAALGWLGWHFNINKFWVSRRYTEFLRYVYTSKSITGYAPRAIGSLLWSSPAQDTWEAENRINAKLDSWVVFLSRTFRSDVVYTWMVDDLGGLLKQPRENVILWLNTPSAVGGAGVFPDKATTLGMSIAISPSEQVRLPTITSKLQVPEGIDQEVSREFTWRGVSRPRDKVEASPVTFAPVGTSGNLPSDELAAREKGLMQPVYTWKEKVWGGAMLAHLVRTRAWDTIEANLEPQVQPLSTTIRRTQPRRVWVDWLTRSLPNLSSRAYNLPASRLALYSKIAGSPGLARLLTTSSKSYQKVVEYVATVQYNVSQSSMWTVHGVRYTR